MTLVNLSAGEQKGLTAEESGIHIAQFVVTVKPEFILPLLNVTGHRIGHASGDPMSDITLNGEFKTGTLTSTTFTAVITLANTINYHGQSAGKVFLEEGTITASREGWKEVSQKYSRYTNVV